jgi:hypothetical protein
MIIPATTLRSILATDTLDIPSDWTTITGFDPSIPADRWTRRLSNRHHKAFLASLARVPPIHFEIDSGATRSISPSLEDLQALQSAPAPVAIPTRYQYKLATLGLLESPLAYAVKCLQGSSTDPFTSVTGEDDSDYWVSTGPYLDPLYYSFKPLKIPSSHPTDTEAFDDDFDFDISLGPIFKTIICCHLVPFTLFLFHRTLLSGSFFAFKVLLLWELLLYTVVTD